jgi:predicted permease
MGLPHSIGSFLSGLIRRSRVDGEMREELRSHIQHRADDLERSGVARAEAERQARVEFGGYERYREACHEAAGGNPLKPLPREMRFAVRRLCKSPGFAAVAVSTLALGIGAVTSVFSVVNGVLLKPFPFRDPDRLIVMREVERGTRNQKPSIPVNYRHFQRLKHDAKSIEDAFIFYQTGESVSPSGDHPEVVGAVGASPNVFRVLGVQPILGRDFADSDAVKGAASVVILSYEGWQTLFGGDAKVIGKTLRMGGEPATVIGVTPPGLRFPQIPMAPGISFQDRFDMRGVLLYEPFVPSDRTLTTDFGGFNYKVVARLRPRVTLARASAELESLQSAYSLSAHLPVHLGIALTPLAKDVTAGIGSALWLLLAAVGAVLLIACVNLANLQLARAANAEHETALRAALGASRARLTMACLAESLVLAVVGGAAGVAMAFAGVRLLLTLVPANVPRLSEVQVNLPVMLFAIGLSIAAAVLFGTLPALRSLGVPPQAALQANSSRTANSRASNRTRSLLVATEVACTVVLLIVTSLVLRSFSHLLTQNRGFDASHVTAAEVVLMSPQYGDKRPTSKAAKLAYADRALTALQQLPGVHSVALTSVTPLTGETWVDYLVRPDHPLPQAEQPVINIRWIDPNYLATMQVPLLAGRGITATDRANPNVALISERTAREGFPSENPIGHKIGEIVPGDNDHDSPVTVIGVVADTRINGLKDTAAMLYAPYWGFTPWSITFLIRSSQPSEALNPEVRRVLWGIDPTVPIPSIKSMDERVGDSVASERFQAQVLAAFGASALLLALLGVYGVLAYSVSLRQREFGIRIALGSGKAALMRLVLRQAAYPVLLGTAAGLGLGLVALRWVRSILYETRSADPLAIAGSVAVLLAVAALAAVLPARHAASVDPVQALRNE